MARTGFWKSDWFLGVAVAVAVFVISRTDFVQNMKRKAYDSAIIYFKDVIKLHPNASKTREAYLRLHDAYKAINYKEDMRDICDAARKAYPSDREVRDVCGPAPAAQASQ